MAESDQHLVRRTLIGDAQAFGDLVERYERLVHGLILETVRRPDETEDLVQEVFCKAYEQLSSLRKPSCFASWIARLASNTAIQWLRHRRVQVRSETERERLLPLASRWPDEVCEERETARFLWEAMDRLAPEQRRAVVLYYLEGCTYREIGRSLGISATAVRWRLRCARRRLIQDLGEIVGQEVLQRPKVRRSVREKILVTLPMVAFFRPEKRGGWARLWGWRAWLPLGYAGILGLIGTALWGGLGQDAVISTNEVIGFRVRRERMELPETSIFWEPGRPRAGEQVRIEAAGVEGEQVELHYITDPTYPMDRVVSMRREGDVWLAELEVPLDAAAVFFYVSPAGETQNFDRLTSWIFGFERKKLEPYARSFLVHDKSGRPVQDAAFKQAGMAQRLRRTHREILACLDREVARYPENFKAQYDRWRRMLWIREDAGRIKTEVERETQAFKARFSDNPEALWWLVRLRDVPNESSYREMRTRFPRYERLDEAAYLVAQNFLARRDSTNQVRVLEDLIASYPDSRYQDEAYRDLLMTLKDTDPDRAVYLADDLIEHRVDVSYDPVRQSDQIATSFSSGSRTPGVLPEGLAYSLRFEVFLQEGNVRGALDLVQGLSTSGLRDPYPYAYIGRRLAGEHFRDSLFKTSPACPQDLPLAIQILEAGLPWTRVEHQLSLPGLHLPFDIPEHAKDRLEGFFKETYLMFYRDFLQTLGSCYLERQDFVRAAVRLQAAADLHAELKLQRRDPELHLLVARTWEQLGEWEKAERAYVEVLRSVYSHPEAETGLVRLYEEGHSRTADPGQFMESLCPVAPDFQLVDPYGREVRLSDFRGRPVLLCYEITRGRLEKMLKIMERGKQRLAPEKVEVLFVVAPGRHQSGLQFLAEEWQRPFPVVMDDGRIFEQYRTVVNGLFLVDAQGRLRLWLPLEEVMEDGRAFQTVREKLESYRTNISVVERI